MNPRTIRDFEYAGETRPTVNAWAGENSFRLVESEGAKRVFQKGHGFWTAPVRVEIEQQGPKVHIEIWIHVNVLVRISSLFMLPKQMGVESGGFRGVLPRKIGRESANKLLQKLGQPLIV